MIKRNHFKAAMSLDSLQLTFCYSMGYVKVSSTVFCQSSDEAMTYHFRSSVLIFGTPKEIIQ